MLLSFLSSLITHVHVPHTYHTHTHHTHTGGVDLDYFRKVHDDVVDILTGKCSEWRAKNETVEAEKEREGVEEERCKILEEGTYMYNVHCVHLHI